MFNTNTTFQEMLDNLKGKIEGCRQEIAELQFEMSTCSNEQQIRDYERWIDEQKQEILRLRKLISGLKAAAIEML